MLDNFSVFLTNTKEEELIDSYYVFVEKLSLPSRREIDKFMEDVKNKNYDAVLMKIINAYNTGIQFSSFACYCVSKGKSLSTLSNFLNNSEDTTYNKKIIKFLVDDFLTERDPEDYLQALYDSRISKKKGSTGQDKLIDIAKKYDIAEIFEVDDIMTKRNFILKIITSNFKIIKKFLKIKFEYGHVSKKPDLLLGINKDFFIIEAKHINEPGGAQDKQMFQSLIESNIGRVHSLYKF